MRERAQTAKQDRLLQMAEEISWRRAAIESCRQLAARLRSGDADILIAAHLPQKLRAKVPAVDAFLLNVPECRMQSFRDALADEMHNRERLWTQEVNELMRSFQFSSAEEDRTDDQPNQGGESEADRGGGPGAGRDPSRTPGGDDSGDRRGGKPLPGSVPTQRVVA